MIICLMGGINVCCCCYYYYYFFYFYQFVPKPINIYIYISDVLDVTQCLNHTMRMW